MSISRLQGLCTFFFISFCICKVGGCDVDVYVAIADILKAKDRLSSWVFLLSDFKGHTNVCSFAFASARFKENLDVQQRLLNVYTSWWVEGQELDGLGTSISGFQSLVLAYFHWLLCLQGSRTVT